MKLSAATTRVSPLLRKEASDEVQKVIRADNQTATDLLRKRVLDLLLDPDPVQGIYAMYGAHVRD